MFSEQSSNSADRPGCQCRLHIQVGYIDMVWGEMPPGGTIMAIK